ncbi:hypothetical protein GCM10009613_21610 [Pseudonocardia kongjuensis]|uniref:Integral membrane protein n=1 Tax=Pseudonocardia kongjuensis TaxID=102227 RepID=A0ABN1XPE4_9PSEU
MGESVGETVVELLLAEPLLWLIGAAEIAFWVFLVAGLAARYLLHRPALGAALLVGVPLMDVVLVVAAVADVASGGEPSRVHGLAAVYLGATVAFGHPMIRWADARFAHRFAGGPRPVRPPRGGPARVRHEWRGFGRVVLAWLLAAGVLCLLTAVGGQPFPEPGQWPADPMWAWLGRLSVVAAIWFVAGPLWATVLPGDDRERDRVRS